MKVKYRKYKIMIYLILLGRKWKLEIKIFRKCLLNTVNTIKKIRITDIFNFYSVYNGSLYKNYGIFFLSYMIDIGSKNLNI